MKNFLAPATNVQIYLSSSHQDVTVPAGPIAWGDMDMMDEFENAADPIVLQIATDAVRDREITIECAITADGGYTDTDYFSFTPLPTYANIAGGNVLMTVSAFGRLGSPDIDRGLGDGFVISGIGGIGSETENLLFEGAVMAAVSADSVSDVARRPGPGQNSDFRVAADGDLVISKPGILGDEELHSVFTDAGGYKSLGLGVTQRVLAFIDPPDADYILLAYSLYMMNDSQLNDLYFGLFMDWDVGDNGASASINRPLYDASADLGIVYDPNSSLYGGVSVVSEGGAGAYKSIDNTVELFDADEYSDAEKWDHLSGGVRAVDVTSPSDYSHVIGVGPLDLAPGDTVRIGFAVIGGRSYNDVRANAIAAKAKWDVLFGDSGVDLSAIDSPMMYRLGANFPNPFNPETRIEYNLAESGPVTLVVYDMLGREVVTLVDAEQSRGNHSIVWDGNSLAGQSPSGMYFYEMRAGSFRAMRKMILIR